MNRKLTLLICAVLALNLAFSQSNENVTNAVTPDRPITFKPQNPTQDTRENVSITGLKGGVSYTTSNISDGTANSYSHSLRIRVPLATNSKTNEYELVFYSQGENVPYSVTQNGSIVSLYFPISTYESITNSLRSGTNARSVAEIKIIQRTNGYREATLVF